MTAEQDAPRVVSASREIAASPERIFELIADPAQQPRWDGNRNLAGAAPGQRVRRVGDVFTMTLTTGSIRENHVVEFGEGRRIAWRPSPEGRRQPGHLWRWELEPLGGSRTLVTHTYDWTLLTDKTRLPRARRTTSERLRASLDRLAVLAESSDAARPAGELADGDAGGLEPAVDVEQERGGRRRAWSDRHRAGQPGIGGVGAGEPFPAG